MEEDENLLEEKSRELLNIKHVKRRGLYLSDIDNLENYISAINYLIKRYYIIEAGSSVKDFHYEITSDGKWWIENKN